MKYYINLFPEKEKDAVDKIMYFAFHYLRYILVITQFIVICVFFFRFKVDQEIVDLKDGLQQKQQIIESTKSLLDEVAFLETKTQSLGSLMKKQENFNSMYNYFITSLPSDLVITSLNFTPSGISCDGYSINPATIQKFKEQLLNEKRFKTVNLESVRKSTTGFSFTLKLEEFNELPTAATPSS